MRPLVKPKALKAGDTVAVVSPAAPTREASLFDQGCHVLEAAGLKVLLMPSAKAIAEMPNGYLAGDDTSRLADIHAAFADDSIAGIWCARGGYGCQRLVTGLNMDLIGANPKALIGFSDVTILHTAIRQQTGLVGFYGPMVTSNLAEDDAHSAAWALDLLLDKVNYPYTVPNVDPWHCLRAGTAQAPLVGGNLTLVAALCGTPWQLDAKGAILFLEDWKESDYSLDRQFQQLAHAGVFDGIAALVLGDFSQCETAVPGAQLNLPALFAELTAFLPASVPVGYGYSIGHGNVTATIPLGTVAALDTGLGQLTLVERPLA